MSYGVLQLGKPRPSPPATLEGGGKRVKLPLPQTLAPTAGEPLARRVRGCQAPCPGPSAETTAVRPGRGCRLVRAALPAGCRAERPTSAAVEGGEGRQPLLAASPLLPSRRPGSVHPAALTPAAPRRGLPGAAPSPQPSFLRRQKPDTGAAPHSPSAERRLCSAAPGAARPCRGPDRRPARRSPSAPCHVSRGAGRHAWSPSGSSSCMPKRPAWAGPRRPAAPRSPTAGKVSGGGRDGTGGGGQRVPPRVGCQPQQRGSGALLGREGRPAGPCRAVPAPGAVPAPSQRCPRRCRDAPLRARRTALWPRLAAAPGRSSSLAV